MREEDIKIEKALLVGVEAGTDNDFERSIQELASLVEACSVEGESTMEVVGIVTQKLEIINKAFYIGTGKVDEVKEYANQCEADVVVFDTSLSPSQIRNLSRELELPIWDRTAIILEIFALRAQTREAKLQVEIAKLQYLLPRLVGMHQTLGRQGGASGSLSNKGSGEKKLELDRRKIEHRISELGRELDAVEKGRTVQRKQRVDSRTPQVALVGYTNAGKSTVMNRLLEEYGDCPEKQVLEQDMLFATLETSVRKISGKDNKPFLLIDTVGFIHKLPHGLVKAFRSTLEEVKYADLLVQIVDFSDEEYKHQMEVTADTLEELGAGDIPMIYVYNKAEKCHLPNLPCIKDNHIYMSAVNGIGIEELLSMMKEQLYAENVDHTFLIPYEKGNVVSYFMEHATIYSKEYEEDGVRLHVNCHRQDSAKYSQYKVG